LFYFVELFVTIAQAVGLVISSRNSHEIKQEITENKKSFSTENKPAENDNISHFRRTKKTKNSRAS